MTMMDDDVKKANLDSQAEKTASACGCLFFIFLVAMVILTISLANSNVNVQQTHEYDVSTNETEQKSWNEDLSSTEKWGIGGRSVMGPIDDYKSRNSLTPRMLMDSVGGSDEEDD